MDFDEIVVKESPGLCRCCLSEGCYKDMGTEYTWMNDNEVYADMLLECFDIGISQHNDGPNGPNRLICEVCITRLRDACNFKKQVLDSEKKFVDMIGRGEFRPKVLIYQSQMKAERNDDGVEDAEVEYLDEDLADFDEDDLPLKREGAGAPPRAAAEPLPLPKRGRPKKTAVKPEKKKKLEDRPKVKSVVKERPPNADVSSEEDTRRDAVRLLAVIIKNSTIMPFRWCENKFMCFYCCCLFNEASQLRIHNKSEHENAKLSTILSMRLPHASKNRIKCDVSEISCKRCPKTLRNLEEFLDHAASSHDLRFNKQASNFLFTFKLKDEEMNCLECNESFKFFGTLLSHAHKYHNKGNTFLCEVCGQGFISKSHADSHHRYYHTDAECKKCSRKFKTRYLLTIHNNEEHNSFQCSKCPLILGSRYLKKRHLALAHDVKSDQFKCEDCGKIFVLRNKLLEHKERVHLKLKTTICPICGFRVFNKELLKRHMVRHDDARPFECDVCKKAFQRKKTLEYHCRIHTDDRRHACAACGKAFVQVASLKLHIRVHHTQ